jgi:Ser/Thr protein kinase RdoA (MazF antagonist)
MAGLDPRRSALGRYVGAAQAEAAEIAPLGDGLINETYLVRCPGAGEPYAACVLQRVNPIFGFAVHDDIEAITAHLAAKGMETTRLVRTPEGALAVDLGAEGVWRILTYVPGQSTSVVAPALCREAGRLVGRFHAALADLSHRFRFSRPGAHDLAAHLQRLRGAAALAEAEGAPPGFAELRAEILARCEELPGQVAGPARICHGDLKISNVRFDEEGRGRCLLDLDTMAHLPVAIEMGDALRSWCNPSPLAENDPEAGFDLDLFAQAVAGYAEGAGGLLLQEEQAGLVAGVERIALQLAARFCADVVGPGYFRFDPARFPSRAAHNMVRARGQLSVAQAVARRRREAAEIVAEVFKQS